METNVTLQDETGSRLHLAMSISFKGNSSRSSRTKAHGIRRDWDGSLEHADIVQEINEAEERLLGNVRQHYRSVAFSPIIDQPAGKRGLDLETCDASVQGQQLHPRVGGRLGPTRGSVLQLQGTISCNCRLQSAFLDGTQSPTKGFFCVF